MSDHPDISVVMGVYNGADHLVETLDSVLAQKGVSLELIVVNDGSTDSSAAVLGEYRNRDSRVRIIEQENQGLTKALIRGCAETRGKYIARQDVGDISHIERLRLQKAALDADQELAFVSCWTEFCGPDLEPLYTVKGEGRASSPIHIIDEKAEYGVVDGPSCHGSVLFRASAYVQAGGYRSEFYYGQDYDLWYRLGEVGTFQMIELPLYMARVMPRSISSGHKKRQQEIARLSLASLRRRRRNLPDRDLLDAAAMIRQTENGKTRKKAIAAGFYFIGECLRKNGDNRSMKYFRQSIKTLPLYFKPWVRILQCELGATVQGMKNLISRSHVQ